ncbi:hypothetical protein KBC70_01950 [Candidatus Woesebacteria bacterium]|nr:hypothetical protein [Candidatus Woesebacteria bacterium]
MIKNQDKPKALLAFLSVEALIYGFHFFIIALDQILEAIGSTEYLASILSPYTILVTLGFFAQVVSIYKLWKSSKPSPILLRNAVLVAHASFWVATPALVFLLDRGVITYITFIAVAWFAQKIAQKYLGRNALVLFVISVLVIIWAGTLSFKDSYCWRKMLKYEKEHQQEISKMEPGTSPWQLTYERNCKNSFNFIESLGIR